MTWRLGQVARELNVGHDTILNFLSRKGFRIENNVNAKLTADQYAMLSAEFARSAAEKEAAADLASNPKRYPVPSKLATSLTSGGKKHAKKAKRTGVKSASKRKTTKKVLKLQGQGRKKVKAKRKTGKKKRGLTTSRSVRATPTHFESNRRRH